MKFYAYYIIGSLVFLSGCGGGFGNLGNVMNEHGFQRFQPNRTEIEPGTLLTLEDSSGGVVEATPVCWRHQAFPSLHAPKSDPIDELELKKKVAGTFTLEEGYLEKVKAKYTAIEDIEMSVVNPSVPAYSDVELYKGIAFRSKPCRDAVAAREANNEQVYTVVKVLRADVTYAIEGTERWRLRGKLPKKILEGLKTDLGGSSINTFKNEIKGSPVHVGLKPDIIGVEGSPKDEGAGLPTEPAEALAQSAEAPAEVTEAPAEVTDAPAGGSELLKVPRLTDTQRSSLIQNVLILKSFKSDADRLK